VDSRSRGGMFARIAKENFGWRILTATMWIFTLTTWMTDGTTRRPQSQI
jgi:hypothetical protein